MNLKHVFRTAPALVLALTVPGIARADDAPASEVPQKVAATRPEMKQILEGSKQSKPRLPLPPAPTAQEQAKAQARAAERAKTQPADNEKAKTKGRSGGLGGGIVNNGRMRSYYLSPELSGGFNRGAGAAAAASGANAAAPGGAGFAREADPTMSLSGTFKTEFFWIVSRANNCYYCQGHQESKLAADGLSEDTIAALDGDWSEFTPAERAAFAFTLKLTKTPQSITDADIAALRAHYKDTQILEIIQTVAGNNLGHARNRLRELGMTDDMIAALVAPGESIPAGERAALALAKKLTVDPARITDADIAALRANWSDFETAEIVFQITEAASFDRLTEAAGLQLER